MIYSCTSVVSVFGLLFVNCTKWQSKAYCDEGRVIVLGLLKTMLVFLMFFTGLVSIYSVWSGESVAFLSAEQEPVQMITSSGFPADPPWLGKMSTEDTEQKKSYTSINGCQSRDTSSSISASHFKVPTILVFRTTI